MLARAGAYLPKFEYQIFFFPGCTSILISLKFWLCKLWEKLLNRSEIESEILEKSGGEAGLLDEGEFVLEDVLAYLPLQCLLVTISIAQLSTVAMLNFATV